MKNKIIFLLTIYFLVGLTNLLYAQCTTIPTANAGLDKTSLCPGNCVNIGVLNCGTSCSGVVYSWAPGGMSTCTTTVCPTVTTNYTLYITYTCGVGCCLDGCSGQCDAVFPCSGTQVISDVMKVTVTSSGCRILNPENTPSVESKDIKVFSNPSSGNVSIQFSKINPGTCIMFYDANGKLVKEDSNIDENKLSCEYGLSFFSKGVYFIKIIEGENTVYFKKLVLQ